MRNPIPFRTYKVTDMSNIHRPVVIFSAEKSHGTHHYTGVHGIIGASIYDPAATYANGLADDFRRNVAETVSGLLILSDDFAIERL